MAIDYTELFTDVGKILKHLNVYLAYPAGSLQTGLSEIGSRLSTSLRYDVLGPVPGYFDGFKDQDIGWITQLTALIETRFLNRDTVLTQLPAMRTGASAQEVLLELIRDMIDNSQDINQSVVTLGTTTAASGNTGTGEVFVTKILDGISAPGEGMPASFHYKDVDSELGVNSETMVLTCVQDAASGGAEGGEVFLWTGGQKGNAPYDWRVEGSGNGPNVTVANSRGLILNGEFEDFATTDTPDNWTIDSGAATTNILEDTVVFQRGTSSLKFLGSGAADIQVSQTRTDVTAKQSYLVAVWIQGQAGILAGDLTIQFEGTGYTAGSTEKISLNAAALAALTAWDLKHFFVNMPDIIPADFELVIKINNTLTSAKQVNFDGLVLTETIWHGGVGCGVVAGPAQFVLEDRFTWTVANDDAGVFQKLFRKHFKIQLPSASGGGESISDTLAT